MATKTRTTTATKVVVYRDRKGQHRWRAVARNGEIIAQGEAYTRRHDAKRGGLRVFPDARVITQGATEARR